MQEVSRYARYGTRHDASYDLDVLPVIASGMIRA